MSDFYTRKSIEGLAREQGVTAGALDDWPIGPWPELEEGELDIDIDEFLAMIREVRHSDEPKDLS